MISQSAAFVNQNLGSMAMTRHVRQRGSDQKGGLQPATNRLQAVLADLQAPLAPSRKPLSPHSCRHKSRSRHAPAASGHLPTKPAPGPRRFQTAPPSACYERRGRWRTLNGPCDQGCHQALTRHRPGVHHGHHHSSDQELAMLPATPVTTRPPRVQHGLTRRFAR